MPEENTGVENNNDLDLTTESKINIEPPADLVAEHDAKVAADEKAREELEAAKAATTEEGLTPTPDPIDVASDVPQSQTTAQPQNAVQNSVPATVTVETADTTPVSAFVVMIFYGLMAAMYGYSIFNAVTDGFRVQDTLTLALNGLMCWLMIHVAIRVFKRQTKARTTAKAALIISTVIVFPAAIILGLMALLAAPSLARAGLSGGLVTTLLSVSFIVMVSPTVIQWIIYFAWFRTSSFIRYIDS